MKLGFPHYLSSKKKGGYIAILIVIFSLLIMGGYKLYGHIHTKKLNRARFDYFYSCLSPYFDVYYNDAVKFQRMLISEKTYPYTGNLYIDDKVPYYDATSYFCLRETFDIGQEMESIDFFFSMSMYAEPLLYPPSEKKEFRAAYINFFEIGTKLINMDINVSNDDLTLEQYKDSVNNLMHELRKCYVIICNPCSKKLPLINLFNPNSFSAQELKLDYYEDMIE